MKNLQAVFIVWLGILFLNACNTASKHENTVNKAAMMVRMANIEVDTNFLETYKAILKEEAEASLRLEPGVLAIFPMYETSSPSQINILEIYASKAAYERHLKTPHFQKYKTATLPMVKSLKLIEMSAIDTNAMNEIFLKMTKRQ